MRLIRLVLLVSIGAGLLAACTSASDPATGPTAVTPTTSPSVMASADTGAVHRYDASTLTKGVTPGDPAPAGSTMLHVTEGGTWQVVDGASGPLSVSVLSSGKLDDVTLAYQLDTAHPTDWTRERLDVGQGVVVDGHLFAMVHWAQIGSQPRVEAWYLDYPASTADQLPEL